MHIYEINKYIDFDGLFKELAKEFLNYMLDQDEEEDFHQKLKDFIEIKDKEGFELDIEECEFEEKQITFSYSKTFNDAYDGYNSSFIYFMIYYDIEAEEFINCIQGQG